MIALDISAFTASYKTHLEHKIVFRTISNDTITDETNSQLRLSLGSDKFNPHWGILYTPGYPIIPEKRSSEVCSQRTTSSKSSTNNSFSIPTETISTLSSIGDYDSNNKSPESSQKLDNFIPGLLPVDKQGPGLLKEVKKESKDVKIGLKFEKSSRLSLNCNTGFSWDPDYLIFAGRHLKINTSLKDSIDLRRSSRDVPIDIHDLVSGSQEPRATVSADMVEQFVLRSQVHNIGLGLLSTHPRIRAFHEAYYEDMFFQFLENIYEHVITFLDYRYWRTQSFRKSCGSDNDEVRNGNFGYQSSNVSHMRSDPSARPFIGPRRSERGGRRNGSEGSSDHGDPRENHAHHPPTVRHKTDSRRVDCPFHKRDPVIFSDCSRIGFKKISHLKQHLKVKHQDPYCQHCFRVFSPRLHSSHVCFPERPRVRIITKKIAAHLNKRADRRKSIEEQWLQIYRIIFPEDKPPFPSPYVQKQVPEILEHFIGFLQENISESWQDMIQNLPPGVPFTQQVLKEAWDEGSQRWLSRSIDAYLSTKQATFDHGHIPRADLSQSRDEQDQNSSLDNILQHNDFEQAPMTGLPGLQQPPNHKPSDHDKLGSDIICTGSIHASYEVHGVETNDYLADLRSIDDHPVSGSLQIEAPNSTQGIVNDPLTGSSADLQLQREHLSWEMFPTRPDETRSPGTRSNRSDPLAPTFNSSEPYPSHLDSSWEDWLDYCQIPE
ncbi:hypothetical protein Daesc_001850 [Daldinia eschscholtzii]|uniref:C2H2-type domain-containing protein n=1 Tax=Daldinia eschscholtzii TaxID=292717 RepID=A0AAX6MWL7_9PEZI